MIRRLDFPPCKRAFLRQDGDIYYLYHGDTGCLLQMEEHPLQFLESPDPEVREEAIKDLAEQGFIDAEAEGKPEEPPPKYSVAELRKYDSAFMSLRSDNAPFTVLWGVAGRCNLNCVYCFPEIPHRSRQDQELSAEQAMVVAQKIVDAAVLEVTLSGGEPLMRRDIFELASFLRDHCISVGMMTNGTLLTEEHARRLKELRISVGLSLDSISEEVNRITRGAGVLDKVKRALGILLQHEVNANLVMTVNRYNVDQLEALIDYADQEGLECTMLQDLRVFGTREAYDAIRLTREQEAALPELLDRLDATYPEMDIITNELLMYKHREMHCPSGLFSVYIDPVGDVFPCTALPTFNMGNAVRENLAELWHSSPAIKRLREKKLTTPTSCIGCEQLDTCHGGCRGDAIFYSGDFDGIPSRCPRCGSGCP